MAVLDAKRPPAAPSAGPRLGLDASRREILNHRVGGCVTGVHDLVALGDVQLLCEVLPFHAEADLPDARRAGLLGDGLQQCPSYPPATPEHGHADSQFWYVGGNESVSRIGSRKEAKPCRANPLPARFGDHAELANLYAYLASDGSGYITGDMIVIDGGRWMQGVGGPTSRAMQDWSDEQWDAMRAHARKG